LKSRGDEEGKKKKPAEAGKEKKKGKKDKDHCRIHKGSWAKLPPGTQKGRGGAHLQLF